MILDGAINWGEGGPKPAADGFDVEARKASIYEWVRQVRGGVLAGAFTVERNLSVAIMHFMLGERMKDPDVQRAFDEGLLAPLTFERRINVALLVAPHVLPEDEVAELKADLSDLRSLRNAMAHRPFWFHPELDAEDNVVNLVPLIMRGKAALPLTSEFIEKSNAQMTRLIAKTGIIASTLGIPFAAYRDDSAPHPKV
jgi:hypothetical protein